MHGFIFSKFLQSLADTFYSMAGNINTGKVRIKLQKLFHDLGCHPLIIVRIPDIHNFNSRKALLDLCCESLLSADQSRICNLSGNNGNLSVSSCHLSHQARRRTAGLKRILSYKT